MKLHFLVDKDGYKRGDAKFVERTLGRRFCENGVAIPYQQYQSEEEERKSELLKQREKEQAGNAASKKAPKRTKAVRKVVKKST